LTKNYDTVTVIQYVYLQVHKDAVMRCEECGQTIPEGRLQALPGTKYCLKCSDKHTPDYVDYDHVVAKSSSSGRNGFAPKD